MQALILWPDQLLLSLFVLWLASVVFLWAARAPMARLLESLGSFVGDGCQDLAKWCREAAHGLRERSREALLAAGRVETQGKLERELQRVDSSFAEQLGQYSKLHRRLDELLHELEADHKRCGEAPPQVPGWSAATEAIAKIPTAGDPNVQKILDTIRKSSQDAEKKALAAYRDDTARRHKTLGAMAPAWKDVRGLMARMCDAVAKAIESTQRIRGYAEAFDAFRKDQEGAARALTWSAAKLFTVSLIVLGARRRVHQLPADHAADVGAGAGRGARRRGAGLDRVGSGDRPDGDGARHLHSRHARNHRPLAQAARDPRVAAPLAARPGAVRPVLPGLRRGVAGGAARAPGGGRSGAVAGAGG
jgi:hypothetical protein